MSGREYLLYQIVRAHFSYFSFISILKTFSILNSYFIMIKDSYYVSHITIQIKFFLSSFLFAPVDFHEMKSHHFFRIYLKTKIENVNKILIWTSMQLEFSGRPNLPDIWNSIDDFRYPTYSHLCFVLIQSTKLASKTTWKDLIAIKMSLVLFGWFSSAKCVCHYFFSPFFLFSPLCVIKRSAFYVVYPLCCNLI